MAIITPEELVGQISASRQPLGQLRTIDNIDGGISASGKIVGTKVGCKGEPGSAATITIGTVSTVSSTTPASVVNVGTPTNAIFNFEIPKGADGGGGGGTWGSITGTLSDQTDLNNALNDKIGKSLTAGLVKNDGTIDTTTYSTFSGNYSDLSGKPTIPTVNDKKITIQKNGTNVDYFTTNNSANKTINITVPTDTNDLTNSAGFVTNSVNDLINYFKKADSTLPVYFVNSSEHNTSGTAFNLTDKPVGLYLFLPNGTTPFDMYITPRTGANTVSFLSILFFAIHIENVLPSVYVSNQINYAFALLGDGKYRSYELSDEGTEIIPTWITKQFITADENNTITGELTFSTLPKSSITPTNNDHFTRKGYVDNQAIKQDLSTAGIDDYSSLSTYTVGNYVSYNNLIYKCNTAIATPEEWDNTHWTQKTYLEYLSDSISSGTVNDSTITIQKGGVTVDSFTTNAANNKTINIPATITESGSNSNGTYIKYSDGTMICTKHFVTANNIPINQSWGSGYTSGEGNLVSLGSFANTFYSVPVVNVTVGRAGGSNAWLGTISNTSNSSAGYVTLLRFSSNTGTKYSFDIIAIGRWKA